MKRFISIITVFIFAISLYAQGLPNVEYKSLKDKMPSDPNVKIGTLSNGIKYYIRANAKPEKRAYLQIVVRAGSIDEDKDQLGLAHFIEHMCFNGTKHFPKNELVKYLESTGMRFGADLNANTSFDRTYYLLQVPTDDQKSFETGFQILQDWLQNVSFDQDELDKERLVILEEWRLYRGAQDRIMKKHFPYYFWGSKYASNDIIGDTAVILRAPREAFLRYYNDWYRPDLSAVIMVGDFDAKLAEEYLMKYFADLKNPANPRKKEFHPIPLHNDLKVSVATDKELPYSMFQVMMKAKADEEGTFEAYRNGMLHNLIGTMLNMRLSELTRKPKPPFMVAQGGYSRMGVGDLTGFSLFGIPAADDMLSGLKASLEESFRAYQHGFTQTELDRAKTTILKGMEKAYNEKDKSESEDYADEYMRNYMFGEGMPGIDYEYAFTKKLMPEISLNELNALTKDMLDGESVVITFSLPEKEGVTPPTEDQIKTVFNEAKSAKLEAYVDKVSNEPLVKRKPSPGTITSTKDIKEINAKELTLSNGAKVVYKKTDFKNDEVLFQAFSFGGTSLVADADYRSAENATEIISEGGFGKIDKNTLSKMMQGKIARLYPYISDDQEGFSGMYAPGDIETFFQLLYSYFTQPRKDKDAFDAFITSSKEFLANADKDPSKVFRDTINAVMGGYNLRSMPFTVDMLEQIKLDKAFQIFKERFADPADFTFIFVGNVEEEKFNEMITTYIGGIPTKNTKENFKDLGIESPKGKYTKKVYKGVDDKATVSLRMYNDYEYNNKNNFIVKSLIELFNIKLLEIVREEKGGVYGVGARPMIQKYPKPEYMISIGFGTDPSRVDELIKTIEDIVQDFKDKPASKEDMDKIKELMKKELEKGFKENNFWLSIMNNIYTNGTNPGYMNERMQMIEKLTAKDIQDAAKKYFNTANYGKFILYPENFKK